MLSPSVSLTPSLKFWLMTQYELHMSQFFTPHYNSWREVSLIPINVFSINRLIYATSHKAISKAEITVNHSLVTQPKVLMCICPF